MCLNFQISNFQFREILGKNIHYFCEILTNGNGVYETPPSVDAEGVIAYIRRITFRLFQKNLVPIHTVQCSLTS